MLKYIFLLPVFLLLSCKKNLLPGEVGKALLNAGSNRQELEKVLGNYSKGKRNKLKFEAACYLIANMPGHYGRYHYETNTPDAIFENIERTLLNGLDTTLKLKDQPQLDSNEYVKYDIENITAEFLISNIEKSFYAWKNYPWCKDMDFEDFKEYILPYRMDNEPLMDLRGHFQEDFAWLRDSIKDNNMKHAFELVHYKFYSFTDKQKGWAYGSIQNLYDVIRINEGLCYHEGVIKSHLFRALGIISTFDEIPKWANRGSNHNWNAFITRDNVPLIIDGDSLLRKHENIHSSVFSLNPPGDSLLSPEFIVYKEKKVAKVFRKTFILNPEHIFKYKSTGEPLPDGINDSYKIDVTDDYLPCYDITIPVANTLNKNIAYICLFNRGNIVPIHWGLIKNNEAVFTGMGCNDILYIAILLTGNGFHLLSDPFVLQQDGTKRAFPGNFSKSGNLIIKRKYPLFGNVLNYANLMYKGRFQGSNDPAFSDATDLYVIDKTYLTPTEVSINSAKDFRFFRYLPNENCTCDIAEVAFYRDSNGISKKLSGKLLYKYEGPSANNYTKAFDGDLSSFYRSDENNTWIGIDLGPGN